MRQVAGSKQLDGGFGLDRFQEFLLYAGKGRSRARQRGWSVVGLGSICGSVAIICSNDTPMAPATAAADTAPWVPSGEARAARNSGMEASLGNRNSAIGCACLQTPTRAIIG